MDLKELAAVNVLVHQLNEVDEKIATANRKCGFFISMIGNYESEEFCERLRPTVIGLLEADRQSIVEALSALDVQVSSPT